MRKVRVGFLNTHPIQYFAPLYAYLNASEDLAVTAFYLSDYSVRGARDHAFDQVVKWDIDLLEGYTARFIKGAGQRDEPRGFFSIIAPGLSRELREEKIDALIVHGHWPAANVFAVAAARVNRIPVFMRGDAHLGLSTNPLKAGLRRTVLGTLYGRMHGVLAVGTANAAFYRAMGVPDRRIFSTPYAVDNARFSEGAKLSHDERSDVRRTLGVSDDRPVVLFAAKLEARKRPGDLVRAAAIMEQESEKFQLVIVGSGPQDGELHDLAVRLGLRNIHFHGFANQSTLPRIYAASDIFVLPSKDEPWGLAVNEAMCVGLPIVASAEIGCVPDLVRDGVNGRTFQAGNITELAAALRSLLVDIEMRKRMGAASLECVSRWSFAEVCRGLRTALRSVGLPVLSGDSNQS